MNTFCQFANQQPIVAGVIAGASIVAGIVLTAGTVLILKKTYALVRQYRKRKIGVQ